MAPRSSFWPRQHPRRELRRQPGPELPSYSPTDPDLLQPLRGRRGIQAWVMNADGSDQHRFNTSGPAAVGGRARWRPRRMAGRSDVEGGAERRRRQRRHDLPGRWLGSWQGDRPSVRVRRTGLWSPDSTKVLLNYNDPAEGDQGVIDVATGTCHQAAVECRRGAGLAANGLADPPRRLISSPRPSRRVSPLSRGPVGAGPPAAGSAPIARPIAMCTPRAGSAPRRAR
jgi:hypothetical protein